MHILLTELANALHAILPFFFFLQHAKSLNGSDTEWNEYTVGLTHGMVEHFR